MPSDTYEEVQETAWTKLMDLIFGTRNVHHDAYHEMDYTSMILRDYLAIDRTSLANQNTFLAYLRTALTLFVAGITFVKFFGGLILEIIGWIFIPIGVMTFVVGAIRYNRMRLALDRVKQPASKPPVESR